MPARRCTSVDERLEQQLARLGDAAADHDALRREEDGQVRDRDPDQRAGARERLDRGGLPGARARPRSSNDALPAARAIARAAGEQLEAAAVAAVAGRAVGQQRCGGRPRPRDASTPRWSRPPSTSPPPTPVPQTMHITSSAPRAAPSRASASANACPSLISATGCSNPASSSVRSGWPDPIAVEVGEEQRGAVAVEEPGERDPDRVDRADAADPARPSAPSTAAGPPSLGERRRLVGGCELAVLEQRELDVRPAEVEAERSHRAVQPPSTVSTAPVTNGAVAR